MNDVSTPLATETRVLVRGTNFQLTEELRNSAVEKAQRLLAYNPGIQQIALTLERTPCADSSQAIVAKGEVMFSGPALLTSVTAADEVHALEYLLQKLDHQLRRSRVRSTAGAARAVASMPPKAGARPVAPSA